MVAFWDKLKKDKEEKTAEQAEDVVADEKKKVPEEIKIPSEASKETVSKKREKKVEKKEEKEAKPEPEKAEKKETKKQKKSKKKKGIPKEHAVMINNVVLRPKVSESALNQNTLAKYVFVVNSEATKNEVAKAVGAMYGVKVRKVNIVNYGPQTRQFRGFAGTKKGFKKAIVSLEKGQSIDVFSE